jgi:hypothetical protein
MKTIEILYFDGCPTWERTIDDVRRILREARLEARVELVRVTTDEEASRLRFLGSPTVRVDGVDVDRSSANATTFGLQCRVYEAEGRLMGSPPASFIRNALGCED